MRTSNLANEAVRQAEVGHVWEEKLSGAAGTIIVKPYQTFRVHAAAGGCTVTMDGVLAATLNTNGDELIFNAGSGTPDPTTGKPATQVTIVIGAAAYVQVARENVKKI
jgi:hypothetical protein